MEKDMPYTLRRGRNISVPKPDTAGHRSEYCALSCVRNMACTAIFHKRGQNTNKLRRKYVKSMLTSRTCVAVDSKLNNILVYVGNFRHAFNVSIHISLYLTLTCLLNLLVGFDDQIRYQKLRPRIQKQPFF